MSQLLQLRAAIIAAIKGLNSKLDVAGHFGRFNEEQLRQFMQSAPAVRVAILGLADFVKTSDDGVDVGGQIGIYVATKDGSVAGSRDEAAISLVEGIIKLCDRNRWGLGTFVKAGEARGAQNLYSGSAQVDGVALWAVDLRQPVRLTSVEAETGALSALFLGASPKIGAAHQADHVQVGGGSNG